MFLFFRPIYFGINRGKARKLCELSDVNWGHRTCHQVLRHRALYFFFRNVRQQNTDHRVRPTIETRLDFPKSSTFQSFKSLSTTDIKFADGLKQRLEFAVSWKSDSEVKRVYSRTNYTKRLENRDTITQVIAQYVKYNRLKDHQNICLWV